MFKNYLTLLAIGLIWGSQFVFQKYSLMGFDPVWIGTFRAILGALTLTLICKMISITSVSRQWGLFAIIGLLEAAIPFVLVPWAQQELSSSITAILMGTLPFYALLLAPVFIKGARISIGSAISVIVGFGGLLVLFYPELVTETGRIDLVSSMAIVFSAISFAIALLLLNRVKGEHPLIVARNVLCMASVQLTVIALMTAPLNQSHPNASSVMSLFYLGVICAGVVYYLYMMSIKNAGAVFTSMTNYLVPAVGVLIGVFLTDESVQGNTWLALAIILSALFINQMFEGKHSNNER
ncbi:DMT family transporter [Vibrio coralliilyticus]|uniref:DMT family transporter n=1 Tax=Vibrio TaxID=662 RepID=UPI0005055A95|nr:MULTISPECIES: DMT family transporter [Vibrio]KFI13373.1 membrane protein [Vibrio sp. B183]NOI20481.1 DMT family transporter [Vibrio coralliilyticus]